MPVRMPAALRLLSNIAGKDTYCIRSPAHPALAQLA